MNENETHLIEALAIVYDVGASYKHSISFEYDSQYNSITVYVFDIEDKVEIADLFELRDITEDKWKEFLVKIISWKDVIKKERENDKR